MNHKCFGLLLLFFVIATNSIWAQRRILAWADEFEGAANAAPAAAKWTYDLGAGFDGGWGNNELQYYTSRTQNAYLDGNGNLVIKAIKENFTGPDNVTRNYTSARLVTRGKFETTYGRIEARIKLPYGQGIWPAFWMLGTDIDKPGVGWPQCGEIDIMEHIGREPFTTYGTLHGPGYAGSDGLSASYHLPNGQRFSEDFHVFAVEWSPRLIQFFVDGISYKARTPADLPPGSNWVFDYDFYLLLNLAVGGNWPGYPDVTTIFPQLMLVDYVRVYSDVRKNTIRR
jgi:beta-glucanase (GH16 family)